MATKQYLTERKKYNGNHPFKGTLSLCFNNKKNTTPSVKTVPRSNCRIVKTKGKPCMAKQCKNRLNRMLYVLLIYIISTVKPAHAVTSIKQSPALRGHLFLVLS
jgi:hypothetical protein